MFISAKLLCSEFFCQGALRVASRTSGSNFNCKVVSQNSTLQGTTDCETYRGGRRDIAQRVSGSILGWMVAPRMQLPEKLEAVYFRNTNKTGYERQSFDI